jgi:hypothetical protein
MSDFLGSFSAGLDSGGADSPAERGPMDDALSDIGDYLYRLDVLSRRASFVQLSTVVLGTIAATVGVLAAVVDQAVLAIVPGVLAAWIAGVAQWTAKSRLLEQQLAYRTGYMALKNEIRLYRSDASHYSGKDRAKKDAILAARLAEINTEIESKTSGDLSS